MHLLREFAKLEYGDLAKIQRVEKVVLCSR